MLGEVIEFYDFSIFAFLATMLANVFFTGSPFFKLIATFSVFATAYIARPIGGIIISHYGDRYGRKNVFIISIIITGVSTFCIALLPTYKDFGILAPILLIALRLIQGLSLGGELPGAVTFVYEHAPEKKRPFATSLIYSGVGYGVLLASSVIWLLSFTLSTQQMNIFGWRIAFAIGGILALLGAWMRVALAETPAFNEIVEKNGTLKFPFWNFICNYFYVFCKCIGLLFISLPGPVIFMSLPPLLVFKYHLIFEKLLFINTIGLLIVSTCIFLFGYCIHKFNLNPIKFFILGTSLLIIFAIPIFYLINSRNYTLILFAVIIFAVVNAIYCSSLYFIVAKQFPVEIRYTSLAVTLNIGTIVSTGLVPLLTALTLQYFNSLYSLSGIIILTSLIALLAALFIKKGTMVKIKKEDSEYFQFR